MAQNPHDMDVVNRLYAATGGINANLEQRKEALRELVGNDQRLMTPATMLVMKEEGKLRDQAMKLGQQPSVAAKALGFAPPAPQMSPAGLGATPQGMQMASAAPMTPPQGMPAPQAPVQMAGGGLTTLPVPDYMFDEQTFANGGIVAFSEGGQKGAADAKARAKQQAEAYLGKPISDAEFDLLLRATHAEASAKSNSEEQAMIMGTILNHARAKGKNIESALYARNAFQSVTGRKGHRVPSDSFVQGPSEKRANAIFDATSLLPRVPQKQVAFTAANRKAYGPGTNVGYLDRLAEKGTQIAGTMFGTNIMPSDVQMARNEPPAPTIYDLARSTLPGISSAAAPPVRDARFDRPPIQYMAQPQMPRAQMPQFDVAEEAPTRAAQLASGLGAAAAEFNPISTARAAEAPKPKAQAQLPVPEWKDPVGKVPYVPTYLPLDPNKPMPSKAKRYADVASQFVGAGAANLLGGALNTGAEAINRTENFFTKHIDPNEGAPAAPVVPKQYGEVDKYTGPGNQKGVRHYTMGEDPALEAALAGKTSAAEPTNSADAAPVAAKETSEEAIARILAANKSDNFWSTMAAAGFGTAAGKSQNALENIGAGFTAALPGMAAANKSDRELAFKQQELAQDRDYQTKMLAAQTPTAIQQAETIAQDLVRQGVPLVVAKARATQTVLEAGANKYAGLPLAKFNAEQIQSHIETVLRTPVAKLAAMGITTEAQKSEYIAQKRQELLAAGNNVGGTAPLVPVKAASYFP